MGFTPAQIDAMSFWEYSACLAGYRAAHGGEERGAAEVTDDQLARFRAMGVEGL